VKNEVLDIVQEREDFSTAKRLMCYLSYFYMTNMDLRPVNSLSMMSTLPKCAADQKVSHLLEVTRT